MKLRNQWEITITSVVPCEMNTPLEACEAANAVYALQNPGSTDDTILARAYRELCDREVVCVNRNRRVEPPGSDLVEVLGTQAAKAAPTARAAE